MVQHFRILREEAQPICHLLEGGDCVVRCVMLDEHGLGASVLRANSSADILVGFPKSAFFSNTLCVLLLEFILQPVTDRISDEGSVPFPIQTQQCLPPVEVHTLSVAAPRSWYSFADFVSAKEHDMLLLLRCLKVSSYASSIKPMSTFDFAEAYPDFDCCDFGDWQVFVGHKLFNGLVAVSSTFDQPSANIDRIYGINPGLLEQFVQRRSK
ncbi:hypothetical protein Y032_0057g2824 [Ancylostoma ceylanicum]|uniref:Uncharacterized protein n=1 Tax=Ancylostoma ceylanicum TaxID=53326 RepID=A0A016U4I6_9BILA|nr:hypothetical protein Y032_0057g2824 [Ancylostoma ceylanicum]